MKHRFAPALFAFAWMSLGGQVSAQTNLLRNGDLEGYTGGICATNQDNAAFTFGMPFATGFGAASELDVISAPGTCLGLPPKSGSTKVALHNQGLTTNRDEFAMELVSPLLPGTRYVLSFWNHSLLTSDPFPGSVEIAWATSAVSSGTLLFDAPSKPWQWTEHIVEFIAPVAVTHIVVRAGPVQSWVHVDAFVLTTSPVSLVCDCGQGSPCGMLAPGTGCINGTGFGAELLATGSASLGSDDLVLHVQGLPVGAFGLVFLGGNEVVPGTAFGNGLRCVTGGATGTRRFPIRQADLQGGFQEGPGLAAYAATHFPPGSAWSAGQTFAFQGWYRDPQGPCGGFFNTTTAVRLQLLP